MAGAEQQTRKQAEAHHYAFDPELHRRSPLSDSTVRLL
jgi:hypothetical protein